LGWLFLQDAMRPVPGGFPPPVCETAFFDLGHLNFELLAAVSRPLTSISY
jgi:hypothetical protein